MLQDPARQLFLLYLNINSQTNAKFWFSFKSQTNSNSSPIEPITMHISVCDLEVNIFAFELFQQFWIISCLLYLFFSISLFFLNWITLHTHFSFLFQINFAPVTRTKLFAIFLKNIIKWILLSLFWNKSGSKNMKRGAWRRTQVKGQILQREGGPFHNKNKLIWSSMHRKRE